jgi:hypothetical protein
VRGGGRSSPFVRGGGRSSPFEGGGGGEWVGCSSWAAVVVCCLLRDFCRRVGQDEGGK